MSFVSAAGDFISYDESVERVANEEAVNMSGKSPKRKKKDFLVDSLVKFTSGSGGV